MPQRQSIYKKFPRFEISHQFVATSEIDGMALVNLCAAVQPVLHNSIAVVKSPNGWHLGEKPGAHFQKQCPGRDR